MSNLAGVAAMKSGEDGESRFEIHSMDVGTILKIDHLVMRFGGLVAVDGVSCSIQCGDITAIIGPNGAGKTTFFNCITGFYKPTEGMIRMCHEDGRIFLLERMDDFRIASEARVVRTFQNIRLFGGMTVLENLIVAQHNRLLPSFMSGIASVLGIGRYTVREREAMDVARYWLDRVGLLKQADDPAASLSYGAQRRLEIARAMCVCPKLLCLDEPAAGLNPRESSALNVLLRAIRDDHGVSVLLIEHDMGVVMEISDHVIVLDHGRKIADASPEIIRNDPVVISAYLGIPEEEHKAGSSS